MSCQWGYCKNNGPWTWPDNIPAARGRRQSPINIVPAEAIYDPELKEHPFKYTYVAANAKNLCSNGHSFQVKYDSAGSSLEGGPLKHKYQLEQFHFHWGKTSTTGSEHRIDDQMYAAELHLVHWNADKYTDFAEAVSHEDGLAVLGIFIEAGAEHTGLNMITDLLPKIINSGDSVELEEGFDPACMLPGDMDKYWTYAGSLTTPPCLECVTWTVLQQPIEMSEDQLKKFRDLKSSPHGEDDNDEFGGHIVENYRPPCPLNDRKVFASFQ